jgi:hypothetical protein
MDRWTEIKCQDKAVKMRPCQDNATLKPNGPAIWGGCVTRLQHRAGSRYFSQKTVTVQGGYGTCFCRHGTNFIAYRRDRGTSLIDGLDIVQVDEARKRHWRSVAV